MTASFPCRSCGAGVSRTFVDLGSTPLANSYPAADSDAADEPRYELHARVCERCLLVQLPEIVRADEIFDDYAYFSSYSRSWVEHAERFARAARTRFGLDERSRVVEVASNDGYLLRTFVDMGVPSLGIEPAANVAAVAEASGVPTRVAFFSEAVALQLVDDEWRADLLVANNVLAHVPDLNDFVAGISRVLADDGVASIEFPHLVNLIEQVQFDTIYHEHFSYFSLLALEDVFARHDLRVFDVEHLPTHGGSLRVFACRVDAGFEEAPGRADTLRTEHDAGLADLATYDAFAPKVEGCRASLLHHLHLARDAGTTILGYGAAAKGNTLLNYCGVGPDLIPAVADLSPHKQGRLLPGSRIPVVTPAELEAAAPDQVLILPWNLADEIVSQLRAGLANTRFIVAVPTVREAA